MAEGRVALVRPAHFALTLAGLLVVVAPAALAQAPESAFRLEITHARANR